VIAREHRPDDVPGRAVPPNEKEIEAGVSPSLQLGRSGPSAAAAISLQITAGNRAVAKLIASGAPGPLVTTISQRAVQRVSEEQKRKLEKDMKGLWELHTNKSKKDAIGQCRDAATAISAELREKYQLEYFCVCWWVDPADNVSMDHYVVIVDGDTVIDATAQQFAGQVARIESFGDWFKELEKEKTLKPPTLAKWVRGGISDCDALTRLRNAWDEGGEQLHKYDPKKVKKKVEKEAKKQREKGEKERKATEKGLAKK
jgi:hypothetical protein